MSAVHFHHVAFSPFPPKIVTRAPVIEFATFLDTRPHFLANVEKFMKGIGAPDECYGSAWGDTVETDVGKHLDGSAKGKATVLLIGWESKEAHMRFRETEVFEKNIGLLREGMGGVEMVSLCSFFGVWEMLTEWVVPCAFHSCMNGVLFKCTIRKLPYILQLQAEVSWCFDNLFDRSSGEYSHCKSIPNTVQRAEDAVEIHGQAFLRLTPFVPLSLRP